MSRPAALLLLLLAAACRFPLERELNPGEIRGRFVYTAAGSGAQLPAEGAQIRIVGSTLAARADRNGRFVLRRVPPGAATLHAVFSAGGQDYAMLLRDLRLETRTVGGRLADGRDLGQLLLNRLGSAAGTVTRDGQPVRGAQIVAPGIGSAESGPDGRYQLFLPDGTWDLSAVYPGDEGFRVNHRAAIALPRQEPVDFVLTSSDSGTGDLSGVASLSDKGAGAGVQVGLVPADGGARVALPATDQNGRYTEFGLPAGVYTVVASAEGYETVMAGPVVVSPQAIAPDLLLLARGDAPDADGDGLADEADPDDDNDGVSDELEPEACARDAAGSADANTDGICDAQQAGVIDGVPPTVSGTTPVADATDVAADAAIEARFSERLDPASVTAEALVLEPATEGAVSWAADRRSVVFVPAEPLLTRIRYTARAGRGVKDLAGNALAQERTWSFTTGASPDTTAPAVTEASPAPDATDVAFDATLSVTLSETPRAATVGAEAFAITPTTPGQVSLQGKVVQFKPDALLAAETPYSVEVRGIRDLAGNQMSPYSWSFSTRLPPDSVAPEILPNVAPASGATDVGIHSAIVVTFSERMRPASVSAASFLVAPPAGGTVSYDDATRQALYTPPATGFAYAQRYDVTITRDVTDRIGNPLAEALTWHFFTEAPPDAVKPEAGVASISDGESDVEAGRVLTIAFSEPIDPASVTSTSFLVAPPVTGAPTVAGSTLSLAPTGGWASNTAYTVDATTDITDLAGNPLAGPVHIGFSTADWLPPTVAASVPARGATGVPVDTALTLTFSEAPVPASVTATGIRLLPETPCTPTLAGSTVTLQRVRDLQPNTPYRLLVSGVEDAAGNSRTDEIDFTTGPDGAPPRILSISPADGATDVAVNPTVVVDFSEAVVADSITEPLSLSWAGGGQDIPGQFAGDRATFQAGPLPASTLVTASLPPLADAAGNRMPAARVWHFTTVARPPQPATPPAQPDIVPVDEGWALEFSEPLDPATVNPTTVTVSPPEVVYAYTSPDTWINLWPSLTWRSGTTYTVTFAASIKSAAGVPLGRDWVYTFRTESPPSLAVGNRQTCLVDGGGRLRCWGRQIAAWHNTPTPVDSATDWMHVAASRLALTSYKPYACGVKRDRTLWCWGYNGDGELGNDGTSDSPVPVQEATQASDWVSVEASAFAACGLKTDRTRWCWGWNDALNQGMYGSSWPSSRSPVLIGSVPSVFSLSMGYEHACARIGNATGYCWGKNGYGELGKGTIDIGTSTPQSLGQYWGVLAAGWQFGCGTKGTGTLWCWGRDDAWQLGLAPSGNGRVAEQRQVGTETDWVIVRAGTDMACGIRADRSLWCWGTNYRGPVWAGPTQIPDAAGWRDVGLSYEHVCAVTMDDRTYCWGANGDGQLGLGTDSLASLVPKRVGTDNDWTAIAVASQRGCGLKGGALACWGTAPVGDGTSNPAAGPVPVDAATDWVQVGVGSSHACGLRQDGTLYCWGYTSYGQVGTGTTTPVLSPTMIGASGEWKQVSARNSATCAAKRSDHPQADQRDTVWCWGDSVKPGTTYMTNSLAPYQVFTDAALTTPLLAESVQSGSSVHCAKRKADSQIVCWGSNVSYQTGTSLAHPVMYPATPVGNVGAAEAWGMYSYNNCAVRASDGSLYCWGTNRYGAFGNTTYAPVGTTKRLPTLVGGGRPQALVEGHEYGFLIAADGTLWAAGYNNYGQLGTGDKLQVNNRVQIGNATWRAVSTAGGAADFSCGIQTDGSLWCWGNNNGNYGDGSAWIPSPRLVPMPSP